MGPKVAGDTSDIVAIFYLYRHGAPDESYPGNDDPVVHQQHLVYIRNSQLPDTATTLDWSTDLNYNYVVTPSEWGEERHKGGINYRVRWFGSRDIYIDQVKVSDIYGRELWEQPSVAVKKLTDYTSALFASSPVIKAWYIVDDNGFGWNRDNVLSVRRTDSLLLTLTGKPGFFTPASGVDYSSLAAYSSISYQSYPIHTWHTSGSTPTDSTSIQDAWNIHHLPGLRAMGELARSKGLKHYATLQGFAGSDLSWRRPTAGEHLCMINLALAYGVKGILYWKYYGCWAYPDSTLTLCSDGFVDNGGETGNRTSTWLEVKNTIGPYIEKMGPIFANLEWQGAWKCGGPSPPNNGIDTILCNEYGNTNQDSLLYLQVAHFHPQSRSDQYFFLVNRRCLASESMTGKVFFEEFSKGEVVSGSDPGEIMTFFVTDMVTGLTTTSEYRDTLHGFPAPWGYCFDYSIPPGSGKLYRVSVHVPDGNEPPYAFSLLAPEDHAFVASQIAFDWEDAIDPEEGSIQYSLLISQDDSFPPNLTHTYSFLSQSAYSLNISGWADGGYYWEVKADDDSSACRLSREIRSFYYGGNCNTCGDADGNHMINISDAVFLINYIFAGEWAPAHCGIPSYVHGRGDADGNALVNISDAVFLINYIFAGGKCPHCKDLLPWGLNCPPPTGKD